MHPIEGDETKKRKHERVKWKTRRRKRNSKKERGNIYIYIYKIGARGDFVKHGKWGDYLFEGKIFFLKKEKYDIGF
jgi:hypothetical protein